MTTILDFIKISSCIAYFVVFLLFLFASYSADTTLCFSNFDINCEAFRKSFFKVFKVTLVMSMCDVKNKDKFKLLSKSPYLLFYATFITNCF